LSYAELKKMVRDSLDHGFLAGASLWRAPEDFRPVTACAGDTPGGPSPSAECQRVLAGSEKAKLEWKEEGEFRKFESGF